MGSTSPPPPTWRVFLPLAVWASVLFVFSAVPGPSLPKAASIFGLDKVVHALLYGVFGALCARGLGRRLPELRPSYRLLVAALAALGYGISDEVHQIFVPGRSADWHDIVADVVGGLLGALVLLLASRAGGRTASQRG